MRVECLVDMDYEHDDDCVNQRNTANPRDATRNFILATCSHNNIDLYSATSPSVPCPSASFVLTEKQRDECLQCEYANPCSTKQIVVNLIVFIRRAFDNRMNAHCFA